MQSSIYSLSILVGLGLNIDASSTSPVNPYQGNFTVGDVKNGSIANLTDTFVYWVSVETNGTYRIDTCDSSIAISFNIDIDDSSILDHPGMFTAYDAISPNYCPDDPDNYWMEIYLEPGKNYKLELYGLIGDYSLRMNTAQCQNYSPAGCSSVSGGDTTLCGEIGTKVLCRQSCGECTSPLGPTPTTPPSSSPVILTPNYLGNLTIENTTKILTFGSYVTLVYWILVPITDMYEIDTCGSTLQINKYISTKYFSQDYLGYNECLGDENNMKDHYKLDAGTNYSLQMQRVINHPSDVYLRVNTVPCQDMSENCSSECIDWMQAHYECRLSCGVCSPTSMPTFAPSTSSSSFSPIILTSDLLVTLTDTTSPVTSSSRTDQSVSDKQDAPIQSIHKKEIQITVIIIYIGIAIAITTLGIFLVYSTKKSYTLSKI